MKNSTDTAAKLNRDLVKIQAWASKWKVTFNAKKSKYLLFSQTRLPDSPELVFGPNMIERVDQHKHLAIIIYYNLDWTAYVNFICLKSNRKLNVLR